MHHGFLPSFSILSPVVEAGRNMKLALVIALLTICGNGSAQDEVDSDIIECEKSFDRMIERLRESYNDDHPSIGYLKNLRANCALMMKKDWELQHPLQDNLKPEQPINTSRRS